MVHHAGRRAGRALERQLLGSRTGPVTMCMQLALAARCTRVPKVPRV